MHNRTLLVMLCTLTLVLGAPLAAADVGPSDGAKAQFGGCPIDGVCQGCNPGSLFSDPGNTLVDCLL